jgi:Tol biopolymer transport system component
MFGAFALRRSPLVPTPRSTARDRAVTDRIGRSLLVTWTLAAITLTASSLGAQPLAATPNRLPARLLPLIAPLADFRAGTSVATDGSTVVIGVPGAEASPFTAGRAEVLVKTETGWTLAVALTAPDATVGDGFGMSVAISGDTIVVGAPGDDTTTLTNAGSAYVFVRTGNAWSFQAKLVSPDPRSGDEFGRAVAVSGATAVIGAPLADPVFASTSGGIQHVDGGDVFVFVRSGVAWSLQGQLAPVDGAAGDRLGHSVGLDGDVAIAGAPAMDAIGAANCGGAAIWRRSGTVWTRDTLLLPGDCLADDGFGSATAMRGDIALVGSPRRDVASVVDQGAAYVIRRGSTWAIEAILVGTDGRGGDQFGTSVALSPAQLAVIGARSSGRAGPGGPGQVLMFQKAGAWNHIETLLGAADGDRFGASVAAGSEFVLAGEPLLNVGSSTSGGGAFYLPADLLAWRFEAIRPGTSVTGGRIGKDGLHTEVAVQTTACCEIYGIDRVGQGRPAGPIVTPWGPVGGGSTDPTFPSETPVASADGRLVAFTSSLPNLLGAADSNGVSDVFVRDRVSGAIERVSRSTGGVQGDGASFAPAISGDGRFVAFASDAANLVPGDTNVTTDIFVHDRQTGVTTRVSKASDGTEGNAASVTPAISGDGRFVAFASEASSLTPGDNNFSSDVFLHDRELGATIMVSGFQANGASSAPAISSNGRWIAYQSLANNLPAGPDANGNLDVFLYDFVSGMTRLVSISSAGTQADGSSGAPAISADGRYVVFQSSATNLGTSPNDSLFEIFVRDLQTRQTRAVGRPALPDITGAFALRPAISDDGRTISYQLGPYLIVRSPRPLIASVSPGVTSIAGGGSVTIDGAQFTQQMVASLDQAPTPSALLSATQVRATAPARAMGGAVGIGLTADIAWHGSFVPLGLQYVGALPTIATVTPAAGPIEGGTFVTIAGTSFVAGGTTVIVGGVPATGVVVASPTHLTAWTPPHASGPVDVVVITNAGAATRAAGFRYHRLFTLTVSHAGVGSGAVTSTPAGIACGGDCSESFPEGADVTLTAAAIGQSRFLSWSVAACGTATTCTVTVNSATTITATFAALATLTVTKLGIGAITSAPEGIHCGATCAADYIRDTVVTLTVTPDPDSTLTSWGGACPVAPTCQVTVSTNLTVSASFIHAPPTITSVTPNIGSSRGGTIVTIHGGAFSSAANVTIGDADAFDVIVVDRATLTLRTAPMAPGVKSVTVRNADGQTITLDAAFTVVSTPPRNPDLDRNGVVDIFDATRLTACLGIAPSLGTTCWEADLDDSGTVNRADLDVLTEAYDQSDLSTDGTLVLRGASPATFNPAGASIWFDLPGDVVDETAGFDVTRNEDSFDDQQVRIEGPSIRVDNALIEGRNRFEVIATGSSGREYFLEVTVWAGSHTINGVLQNITLPLSGTVTATIRDEDDEASWTVPISRFGTFQFTNVPGISVALLVHTADGRIASTGVRGDTEFVYLRVPVQTPPSTVDNNDLSQGVAGWEGDGIVGIVPHVESGGGIAGVAAAADNDIVLRTQNIGPRYLKRVFNTKPGSNTVTVRFRFTTTEFPRFFGTAFDDQYTIVLSSRRGTGFFREQLSMNGLGRVAFDPLGQTAWREVSLPINPDGDIVEFGAVVVNVGDGAFDSDIIIDKISETNVRISRAELLDIDNAPLRYLSASPHEYLDDHRTHIHGRLAIDGSKEDAVKALSLEILRKGEVVATARLAGAPGTEGDKVKPGSAADQLLRPFGPKGKVEVTAKQLLFTLGAEREIPAVDTDLELRLAITTELGGLMHATIQKPRRIGLLVRVTDVNHYSDNRDPKRGGDDWARPSLRSLAYAFPAFTWNDFSNMNGGSFAKDHKSHQRGNDADGVFDGYRDPGRETINGCHPSDTVNAVDGVLAMLSHPVHGPRIRKIFVTCSPKLNPASPFWKALEGQTFNGRKATDIVKHLNHHFDHFHVRILEKDGN